MTPPSNSARPWWQAPWFLLFGLVLVALPLALPDVPPLTDMPGHLGRYKIAIDLPHSEHLQRFYGFQWAVLPNLGVDLAIVPFAWLLGIEAAGKTIVILSVVLTLAGFLWVAHEAHGSIPPSWMFAAPLILGYPFHYGFLNFLLAMALGFLALGLWLRLGRLGWMRRRAALFLPIGFLLWLAHGIGWGVMGLLFYGFELARQQERGRPWSIALVLAGLHCLPLAGPVLLTLIWGGGNMPTGDWFNVPWKLASLVAALRDRWMTFDLVSVIFLLGVIGLGAVSARLRMARGLAIGAVLVFAAFVILPQILFGSARTDVRLVPYFLAAALLGIGLAPGGSPRFAQAFAIAGLAFLVVRLGGNTASLWLYHQDFQAELQALDHVPRGARLVAFVGNDCTPHWGVTRLDHLPGLAVVRREAFSNDQWTVAGSHLLRVNPPWTRYVDPTHFVTEVKCSNRLWHTLDEALAELPQQDFDLVWLVRPPAYDATIAAGWTPVWRRDTSVLYALRTP